MKELVCTETLENTTLIWKELYMNKLLFELRMNNFPVRNISLLNLKSC